MATQSRLATGYWMRKAILMVLFFGFGLWGVYDGWLAWPREAAQWREYNEVYLPLEDRVRKGESLIGEDFRSWNELKAKYPQAPRQRTDTDVGIQRWIIVPLCFGVGALFLLTWRLSARRSYTYNDDGSLVAPEGAFRADEMTGIDMTRWMSKSIAMLEISGGPKGGGKAVKLDAWIYANLEDIIETLNKRFHPDEYKSEDATEPETDADEDIVVVDQVGGLLESDGADEGAGEDDSGDADDDLGHADRPA